MRIHIKYGYRGAPTNEVYLPVGEHDVADDLALYLIENGHAVAVETAPAPPVPAPLDELEAARITERYYIERDSAALEAADNAATVLTHNYADSPYTDLKELAEARGLEVIGTGRNGAILKADLVRALESADNA